MKTANFTEFRHHAKAYFDQVENNGETIQILRHGKVIAKIVPIESEKSPSWKHPGLRLAIKGISLSDTIISERKKGK